MLSKLRGEIYLLSGALLFSFNGIISKIVLVDGLSAWRLTQIRTGGAFVILFAIYFTFRRSELKTTKKELPWLIAFGVVGVALVQAFYFVAIERLYVGVALLIEFTAPIWIALWIKYVRKAYVPTSMWVAIALSFAGLALLAQVWKGLTLDGIGLLASLFSAFALTAYFLMGKKFGTSRSAQSLTVWGLGMAALTWIITMPVWQFPFDVLTIDMDLKGNFAGHTLPGWALILWIVVMGTIVPYLFVIGGLRLLSESTSSVIGMLEPVLAGVFAWMWLQQSWNAVQLAGGMIVLVGIYIADNARSKSI